MISVSGKVWDVEFQTWRRMTSRRLQAGRLSSDRAGRCASERASFQSRASGTFGVFRDFRGFEGLSGLPEPRSAGVVALSALVS